MVKVGRVTVLVGVLVLATAGTSLAGRPVNVAPRLGIAEVTRSFSVNPVDFDRDDRQDFFLVRHNPDDLGARIPPSTLYRRVQGRYANYATDMFRRTDKHGCDWGDANVDGRPDMFCAVGLTQRSINELWIQKRDGTFENQALERGFGVGRRGRARYATFIHANNDVWPDVYVARYTGSCFCDLNEDGVVDYDGDQWPNELWINERGSFRKAPEFGIMKPVGAKKDNATCVQAVDYDNDGDQDLLVCAAKALYLYRNNDGNGFTDVTRAEGVAGNPVDARFVNLDDDRDRDFIALGKRGLTVRFARGAGNLGSPRTIGEPPAPMGLATGSFNRGGTVDIYVLSSWLGGRRKVDQPDRVFLNRGDGVFEPVVIPAADRGGGDDVAPLDFDRDGQTDFVVTNGQTKRAGPVQLWTWQRG